MDLVQNQEDSGVMEVSAREANPSPLYTPVLKTFNTRKRKLTQLHPPSLSLSNNASPYELDGLNPNILSSTLNDSITSQLEHCNINTSFIAETSPPAEENTSEPSTPSKHFPASYSFKMSPKHSPKLGSPERTQILYPKLHPTSKKRFNDFKRGSPAKKQLFNGPLRRDPVNFFLRYKSCEHIVKKIFKALPDRDLYVCSRVSKRWKAVVMELDGERLKTFRSDRIVNKENYSSSPNRNWKEGLTKQSTPIPRETAIYELTNSLTEGQHLQHCPGCNNPSAVVQLQISQCSRDQCGYITCLKCGSFSTTGPKNFIDSCENAMLLCTDKPQQRKRPSLLDSPRKAPQDSIIPSFFQDDSHNTINSSGYATESDLSANNSRSFLKDRSHVLKNCNADLSGGRRSHDRRSSPIVPVVPLNVKKAEPVYEPSSPPKVKPYAVGSKRSKKALRRL